MVKINLLPEEFRLRKRRLRISPRWGYAAVAVGGVFLILLLLTLWQRSRLGQLETDIRQTRAEAQRHKADLELVRELTALKDKILQRMQVVEQLNQNRTRWIEILTSLSQSIPEDMWLTSFKDSEGFGQKSQAQLHGMSFSLRPIALFMDRVDKTKCFSHPRFSYARRVPIPEGMAYDFEIVAGLFSYEKKLIGQEASSEEKDAKGEKGRRKEKSEKE